MLLLDFARDVLLRRATTATLARLRGQRPHLPCPWHRRDHRDLEHREYDPASAAANEADTANPDVVVLSFETWQRYFDGDPAVVGQALEFRGGALSGPVLPHLMTVIGVLPAMGVPNGAFDFYWPLRQRASTSVAPIRSDALSTGISPKAAFNP
jgi:MacB-like protein